MADDSGVWLHAVTRGLDPHRLAGLTGVGGGPVRAVEAEGLAAVVSSVDLNEFGEEPLRRNLEDLPWLETVARTHHAVVDAVGRQGPVVPTRLATVYRDDARIAAMLAERRADFSAVLDRVSGRLEWGVKMYAVSGRPPAPEPAEPSKAPAAGGTGPGTAYLRRRRAQLSADERAQQAALDSAEEVHAALARCAEAARRHPPQDRRLSGQAVPMVLNGAYLVDTASSQRFGATVTDLAGRYPAIRLELTGPWPPYSFATIEDEAPSR
jgi:hypothetical protein